MISVNRGIFHTDIFHLQYECYLITKTAQECVLTNSNTKWILQSSALFILTSWIQKCLWIWKIAAGGWSHLPYLYSLWLHFLSYKWLPLYLELQCQTFLTGINYCYLSLSLSLFFFFSIYILYCMTNWNTE